jgi:flagellar basal body-associated protein FliL
LLHAPVCSLLGAEADREARRTEKEKNKSRVKALIITATVIACVAALLLMFHR